MRSNLSVAGVCVVVAFFVACGSGTPASPAPYRGMMAPGAMSAGAGVQKQAINGTIRLIGVAPPERTITTPGGICQTWELPEFTVFDGDVQGPVTFHASSHRTCDGTHLVASGPFDGQMTFGGRTGSMAGMWTTNCKLDPSAALSCDGTMNARGRDGLEGVQFHFDWGPGWFPFPYTGTAFSQ